MNTHTDVHPHAYIHTHTLHMRTFESWAALFTKPRRNRKSIKKRFSAVTERSGTASPTVRLAGGEACHAAFHCTSDCAPDSLLRAANAEVNADDAEECAEEDEDDDGSDEPVSDEDDEGTSRDTDEEEEDDGNEPEIGAEGGRADEPMCGTLDEEAEEALDLEGTGAPAAASTAAEEFPGWCCCCCCCCR
jgi:hypothetical protein